MARRVKPIVISALSAFAEACRSTTFIRVDGTTPIIEYSPANTAYSG